jgi:hypothetical protein
MEDDRMRKIYYLTLALLILSFLTACGSGKSTQISQNTFTQSNEPKPSNNATSNNNRAVTQEKQTTTTNQDAIPQMVTKSEEPSANRESLIYTNKKLGFSITFPESWKGRYLCKDTDWGVDVLYKAKNADNVSVFQISLTTEIQFAIDEAYVGFMKKLGQRDFIVFIHSSPTGVPYDDKNEKYKDDSKAYFELFNNKDVVLKTFKILPDFDALAYSQFKELNKKKDDSLKKDYDKLKQQEKQ